MMLMKQESVHVCQNMKKLQIKMTCSFPYNLCRPSQTTRFFSSPATADQNDLQLSLQSLQAVSDNPVFLFPCKECLNILICYVNVSLPCLHIRPRIVRRNDQLPRIFDFRKRIVRSDRLAREDIQSFRS